MNTVINAAQTCREVTRAVTCGNCGTSDTKALRSLLTGKDYCRTCLDQLHDRRRSWTFRRGSIYKTGEFPKHCSCGTIYSEQSWSSLRYAGVTPGTVPGRGKITDDIEMRDCPCGSTIGVALITPEVFLH